MKKDARIEIRIEKELKKLAKELGIDIAKVCRKAIWLETIKMKSNL